MKKAFLFLLGLIAFIGVQAQTSPYKGSEAAAGNFYIYNVETGYWLQNNNRVNDWNSQVQVDTEGFDWELIAREDGTWQLNPKFGNNHSLNSGDANGYMDTGQAVSAWTLTPANDGNNGYKISSNGTTLGVNPETKLLTKDGTGATTWQLVTFAERWRVTEQKFSEVTGDNPMDLTWLIPGANMNVADEHFNDLIKVAPNAPGNFTTGQTNVAPGNGVREVWSNTNGGYDFGYKVTNLPAGVYRFTVKGYYSDGPRRDVGAKYKEGTEVIRPQVYANEKSQPILSICAPEKSSAVNGCNTNSSGIFVPNNTGEASQATAAGLYDNPAIKIVLADGADEIDLGVKCEEAGIGDDWVILDKFQLVYYGPDNIESSLALLNAAIEEAENWDQSSTSTAMANMLSEAIEEARAKLTSTDSDEVEAAADALKAALKAAQAVDVSVLKATVELAKAEGIETTEAEQVIENATDGGAIGSVLNDLRVARKVAHLETDEATYEGNEPAEGDFYLYNVGRKAYLSNGSDWGTHAILGYPGLQATLATRGEGFTFQFNELIQGDARDKFMNASPYLDGEAGWATTYIFEPVEGKPGVYYIKGDGRGYLAFDPNGEVDGGGIKHFNTVTSLWATPEGEDAEWMLITKEQRLAQLENASKENPVDATLLIRDASFNKFAALDNPWTDINQSWGWGDRNFGDKNTESWNSQSYNLSQEVTFPKAGKYILSVQAYYRDGNRDTHANKVKNGETLHDAPVLYAGDVETPIVYIDSEVGKAPGEGEVTVIGEYPNYMNQAAAFFQNGLYWNSIEVEIPEDNTTLTIGIKKTGSEYTGEDWTLADNFRLTYLGEVTDYDRALASIESGKNYSIFTEIDGEKYYVTEDGHLTTSAADRGAFEFEKVTGGDYVEYGFKMKNGPWRFTNPPLANNVANLTPGSFSRTTGNDRSSWEAQVFFKEGDLYAIRSCNVHDATSSWNDAGRTYWTYSVEEAPTPEYTYERVYLWQLEENTIVDVAYNLVYEEKVVKTENVSIATGKIPVVPQSFYTEMAEEFNGLVFFKADAEEITEETTEVNFAAESAISESFERAKWFNMNIRGSYWVTMDETEPYYPTVDKDLESEASLWAFGAVEGEPNQIVIWNRAAGPDMSLLNTGEVDANQKPLVAMREGQTAWDFAPNSDGFVIHQVGTGENEWVNQNGGASGPFSIWNSAYAKGDGGSVLRIFFVEETEPAEDLEIAIDVERYVGQGYTPTIAEVDFTEALEYLGVEAVTEDMLYFVNPDGTEMDYATYKVSPTPEFTYDGWCDAEGAAAQWNSTTNMINVKFFEAIPDGQFSICDMNGADEVGKTYTVKWALKANDKAVVYAVNVTFVDAPELTYTFDELDKVATEDLNVKSEIGDAYEGLNATVDIDAILAALEVESLGDVIIAAVQPDGTLDTNYMLGGTDGWRDADGTWKSWSDNLETAPYFYVKANFEATPQIYEAGGYPGHTDEAATFTAPFVFVKNGTNQAYVLNVNLVYGESGAVAYDGTVDVTGKIQGQVVAEAPTADETITITPNEDGTVNINFASLTLAAPGKPVNDFIVENVVVTENEDGSVSYSLEGATISLTAASGMIMTYNATLTGTQAEGEGPEITLILAQPSGLQNEIVFHPNALVPEAEEFDGMIKQILSHPQTGVQGQATGEQKVTIAATGDGKADITYSGFTMPVTGAEIPEFTVEGVIVTENEDGTISYALPEDAEAEVIIDRGTGVVKYAVTLEGTQESADATPVLKLTLENSVVDTVWFGADEKTIDKAIATSIRGINALGTEGNIYDLSGRKVEKIQRGGIYIVNGKKVSVK